MKEQERSYFPSVSDFGTLSTFGMKELSGVVEKLGEYFGTLSTFGMKERTVYLI